MTNQEALNDFRRRYEGTYVWLSLEEQRKETLVHVDRVEDSSSKIGVLHLSTEEYGVLTINFGSSDHALRFKYPPVGVFQHGNDAYTFTRRPNRQYRRGLCNDNSSMANVACHFVGHTVSWTAPEVASAFKATTYDLDSALGMLMQKATKGVALHNNYAITKSFLKTGKEFVLFAWNSPIALVDNKGKLVNLLEKVYEKELVRIGVSV